MWEIPTWFIMLGMVITGSANTLSTALADRSSAAGTWSGGKVHQFNHPFFQAFGMFIGEVMCLFAYKYTIYAQRKAYKAESDKGLLRDDAAAAPVEPQFSPFIFWLPALCDMTGTSLMYIGLSLTTPSVFQMMRGAVIIFTGILSITVLKRKLFAFNWLGMLLVLAGLGVVGYSSIKNPDPDAKKGNNPLLGDMIIIAAQLVAAVQAVIEEKVVCTSCNATSM
jgi:drug/metabolite transporter (DMT)-like permease